MSTQTFLNGETGLSIRTKINSVFDWSPTFNYNLNDITHASGSLYSSLINNNSGNPPISSSLWKTSDVVTSSYAERVDGGNIIGEVPSASWAGYVDGFNVNGAVAAANSATSATSANTSTSASHAVESATATVSVSSSYASNADFTEITGSSAPVTLQGYLKTKVQGLDYWVPFYSSP